MKGYKALIDNLTNRYGYHYEIGKKNILNGELKWGENGFHFCLWPEDTLRYVDGFNDNVVFAIVEAGGELILYEDEYYGFYDMYASSEMTIIDVLNKHEIFNIIVDSGVPFRVERMISLLKLDESEQEQIIKKYPGLIDTINYYQSDEYILKRKLGK